MISAERIAKGLWWQRAWSLVERCTPVSEGCEKCWSQAGHDRWGSGEPGVVVPREGRLEQPLKRRKPTVYAIWDDLFHEAVPDEFICRAWNVMAEASRHRFVVLTKRIERARHLLIHPLKVNELPPPNLILGTSAENQPRLDERLGDLLACPAACRILSLEPLLGPIRLRCPGCHCCWATENAILRNGSTCMNGFEIDCVVVGPETGAGRRPCKPEWIESIVEQCKTAGVPVFVKAVPHGRRILHDTTLPQWPSWAVRELPGVIEVTT